MNISVNGLTKHFGRLRALDDVSFAVPTGRITALLGPNGAGKSTVLRALAGLVIPDTGTVSFDARPAGMSHAIGFLLDPMALHSGRTVRETVRLHELLLAAPARSAETLLQQVGLGGVARRRVGALSLGMRQRLALVLALVGDPRCLVLDEPLNGLDPDGARALRQRLVDFSAAGGTVLIASHLLREVQTTADRVIILHQGRVALEEELAVLAGQAGCLVQPLDEAGFVEFARSRGWPVDRRATGYFLPFAPQRVGPVLSAAGVSLGYLAPQVESLLEDVYLEVTSGATALRGTPAEVA
ncbi:MAG: ATP-binding cassette domain-containing protein [Micropruina sp.]|nr:ATP-binding cassette domain-containing protein [Micropruina sp.]